MTPWYRLEALYEHELVRLLSARGPINTLEALDRLLRNRTFQREANSLAQRMVRNVLQVNSTTWRQAAMRGSNAQSIWRALKRDIESTPLGRAIERMVEQNAERITTLPLDVARSVTRFVSAQQQNGIRAEEIALTLRRRIPELTASQIKRISRTEVGKAEAALTRARSEDIGVNWFQWLSSEDQRVRPSHRNLNLVLVRFDDPPQPEELIGARGTLGRGIPGEFPFCRCAVAPLITLDEVRWPCRVYASNHIRMMTRAQFSRRYGFAVAA